MAPGRNKKRDRKPKDEDTLQSDMTAMKGVSCNTSAPDWKDDIINYYRLESIKAWKCYMAASLERYNLLVNFQGRSKEIENYTEVFLVSGSHEVSEENKFHLLMQLDHERIKLGESIEKEEHASAERFVRAVQSIDAGNRVTDLPSIDPEANLNHFLGLVQEGMKKNQEPDKTDDEILSLSFTGSTDSEDSASFITARSHLDSTMEESLTSDEFNSERRPTRNGKALFHEVAQNGGINMKLSSLEEKMVPAKDFLQPNEKSKPTVVDGPQPGNKKKKKKKKKSVASRGGVAVGVDRKDSSELPNSAEESELSVPPHDSVPSGQALAVTSCADSDNDLRQRLGLDRGASEDRHVAVQDREDREYGDRGDRGGQSDQGESRVNILKGNDHGQTTEEVNGAKIDVAEGTRQSDVERAGPDEAVDLGKPQATTTTGKVSRAATSAQASMSDEERAILEDVAKIQQIEDDEKFAKQMAKTWGLDQNQGTNFGPSSISPSSLGARARHQSQELSRNKPSKPPFPAEGPRTNDGALSWRDQVKAARNVPDDPDTSGADLMFSTKKPVRKFPESNCLNKTSMCWTYQEKGTCPWGVDCIYAHGEGELRKIPSWYKHEAKKESPRTQKPTAANHKEPCGSQYCSARTQFFIKKTVLCKQWLADRCTYNIADCKFAHGTSELRPLPKHEICKRYLSRKCHFETSECVYAHSADEIRPPPSNMASGTSTLCNGQNNVADKLRSDSPQDEGECDWENCCTICAVDFSVRTKRYLLSCGHDSFHWQCISQWFDRLEDDPTCPICRVTVEPISATCSPQLGLR